MAQYKIQNLYGVVEFLRGRRSSILSANGDCRSFRMGSQMIDLFPAQKVLVIHDYDEDTVTRYELTDITEDKITSATSNFITPNRLGRFLQELKQPHGKPLVMKEHNADVEDTLTASNGMRFIPASEISDPNIFTSDNRIDVETAQCIWVAAQEVLSNLTNPSLFANESSSRGSP